MDWEYGGDFWLPCEMPTSLEPLLSTVVPPAIAAHLDLLAQARDVVRSLGSDHYARKSPRCFNSSAGGHFRHVIEHYRSALAAVETGDLDYEKRAREVRLEEDPAAALAALEEVEAKLLTLAGVDADRGLRLAAETEPGRILATTWGRELEFLLSHTVHHHALIAVIALGWGVAVPTGFGLAPSTMKHQRGQAACAH